MRDGDFINEWKLGKYLLTRESLANKFGEIVMLPIFHVHAVIFSYYTSFWPRHRIRLVEDGFLKG